MRAPDTSRILDRSTIGRLTSLSRFDNSLLTATLELTVKVPPAVSSGNKG